MSTGVRAPARRRGIACFVTPHGFGHAARAAAVVAALLERRADLRPHLFTTVPRWFFAESLGPVFSRVPMEADVGLVQRGPLGVDLPATVRRLRALYPPSAAAVRRLAGRLTRLGCALVLCDISPLGVAAARAAGLPCAVVENFTWSWIYRGYAARAPGLRRFAELLEGLVCQADLRLQAEPVCRAVPGGVPVGPVSRRPRLTRAAARAALGVAPRRPLLLVTMGGIPHEGFALEPLLGMPGVEFVLPGGASRRRRIGNVLLLPRHSGLYHPDLVAASDAVVGKIGYSTLAETCRARVPYGFVPRAGFRESAALARWLLAHDRGVRLEPRAFAAGEWVRHVPDLLDLGRPPARFPDGARQAADLIIDRFGL